MSGTKTQALSGSSRHSSPVAGDHHEALAIPRADRDDEPAAVAELVTEGLGHGRRGGGDDDPVPRRAVGIPEAAVRLADRHRRIEADGGQARPGLRG